MDLRTFAERVVRTADLRTKLAPAPGPLSDENPGPAVRLAGPGRPPELAIQSARKVKVPAIGGMADPAQRVRILHAFANHELQAAELFAWALLAFPDTPAEFRRGLAAILSDEQRHTRMYIARVEAHGARFGDFPVNGYFWHKTPSLRTPLEFIAAMSLTFENANLDHTAAYAAAAERAGDGSTARVIEQVGRDEIRHVAFGWHWLQVWKGADEAPWDAWSRCLTWPLRPAKARGAHFVRAGREAAGLDGEFITRLEAAEP